MKLIEKIEELEENIKTLDNSLKSLDQDEKDEAESLIKKGRCFVKYTYKDNKEIKFAPSKFIGYKENTIKNHIEARGVPGKIDGRKTNRKITQILKQKDKLIKQPKVNEKLNEEYKDYCATLNINPDKNKKKFWNTTIEIDKK